MKGLPRTISGTAALSLAVFALAQPAPAAAAPALAQAPGAERVLTPQDVARIQVVGDVQIHPSGAWVAYTRVVPRVPGAEDDGPARVELHVVRFNGTDDRAYVTDANVSHVRFSPDGSTLTYLAKREGDPARAIYGIAADGGGGESFRIVAHETNILSFDWRPDGRAIAFVATEPWPEELRAQREKGFDQEIFEEDGRPRRVYVAELPQGPRGPASAPRMLRELEGHPTSVAYGPDGARLLADPAPTPLIDDQLMARRLRVVDAGSGRVLARIENPGKLSPFRWSPDGRTVAFVSAADLHDPSAGRLTVASAEGGPLRDILPGLEGHVEDVRFAANGELVYLAAVGVGSRIGRIRADGSRHTILYDGIEPVVQAMALDRAGRRAALAADSKASPREVFALRADRSAEPRRITEHNPWLRDVRLGRQEVIEYEARDGLRIQGIVIHPVARGDRERVPTIVVAHGGPESRYANGWLTSYSLPGQVAAGRGFAVFYPNYRASTGRGVEFSKADHGDPVGAEFDDVLDGVDHLVARGLADRERVGITGGSYGGYFTAWGATRHSERFAAGVMFVGLSDLVSFQGTTEIPREMELVHFRANAYENLELFLDRSPLTHAKNAQTPLLILHGKSDTRVDPTQSHELYRALESKGDVPVRLVLYPGEGHGNSRAASRYDYSLRMLRWFDWFLKEGRSDLPPWQLEYEEVRPAPPAEKRTSAVLP